MRRSVYSALAGKKREREEETKSSVTKRPKLGNFGAKSDSDSESDSDDFMKQAKRREKTDVKKKTIEGEDSEVVEKAEKLKEMRPEIRNLFSKLPAPKLKTGEQSLSISAGLASNKQIKMTEKVEEVDTDSKGPAKDSDVIELNQKTLINEYNEKEKVEKDRRFYDKMRTMTGGN